MGKIKHYSKICIIRKSSIQNFFIALFLLIVFTSPIVRFAVDFYFYLLVISIIATFVFVDFVSKTGRYNSFMYIPLLLLLGMFLYIGISQPYKLNSLYYSAVSMILILVSYWTMKQDYRLVKTMAFVALLIYYQFFIYSGLVQGFMPADVNSYLGESSRNAVSAIALFLQVLYSAAYYRVHQNLPLFTPIFTLIIAIVAFGRSGIGLSAMLVVFTYLLLFLQSNRLSKLLVFTGLIIVFFILVQNLQQISDFLVLYTNFQTGLDSPRYIMNQEYVSKITFESFLIGLDLSTIPIIHSHSDNPHNSVILAHSQFGFLYVLFLMFFALFVGYVVLVYKNTVVYGFLLLLFLTRISIDILALLGVFDFIFYFLVFCIYEAYKKGEARSLFKKQRSKTVKFKREVSI